MREFVYLDEVSLQSLLASQTGALTAEVSIAMTQAEEAEAAGSISASASVLKSEVSSRFQTSNSRSTQTSRKAIVQSLFKEFRELESVPFLIELPSKPIEIPNSLDDLRERDGGMFVVSEDVVRGVLVEVEVELVADPIFRVSTIISELADLADEYPEMTAVSGTELLNEMLPINRALQRLLSGLIPVRATAVGLCVAHDGDRFAVVHRQVADALGLATRPLEIVGITEHLGYWKDIRRVLFSRDRFTMLCRVNSDGFQADWTPVRLAEVLAEIAPDFPSQLSQAGKLEFSAPRASAADRQQAAMINALNAYRDKILSDADGSLSPTVASDLDALISRSTGRANTVAGQKAAFNAVADILDEALGDDTDPDQRLQSRRDAREKSGLALMPQVETLADFQPPPPTTDDETNFLLDTEVIAIYW